MNRACETAYGRVSDRLETAFALPSTAYSDTSVFEAEVKHVFRAGWIPAARESEFARAGDYRAVDLFGMPLVLTRDAAGDFHLLSRICRHRGMPLVEGSGNANALTCPYHLWRYGLDGRLAAAPAMQQSKAFERANCALPTFRIERWGGWVFANLDGAAPPLAPQLAPLAERLAAADPASLVTADLIELDSPWNWKVMVENFMESYHHIGPHAGTLQQTNPGLGTGVSHADDAVAVLENPASEGHQPFVVAAIYPLTLMFFSEGPGPQVGLWYEMDRISLGDFRLRVHLLCRPEMAADPAFVAGFRAQAMAVHLEDIAVCERLQAGVTSPLYDPGPLSHLEAALWRFHAHLRQRLAPSRLP
jgi:phenylpropionate dioxygenase-like ring-hydroxylating dioxygenase large terminal subunit